MKFQSTAYAQKLLLEGQQCLADIETNGVRVDRSRVEYLIGKNDKRIKKLKKKIEDDKVVKKWRRVYGEQTNLGSGKQLRHILFDVMGYKSEGETESGLERTDKAALEKLQIPFIARRIEIEKIKKTQSTYLKPILREAIEIDKQWFVYPHFTLNIARTFRSTSNGPNWQNQPVRDEEIAAMVRSCYLPRKGRHFWEIDYAQIEVRISACYNKDAALTNYINDKTTDMHRDTACKLYMLKPDQVSKEIRHTAKNMFVFPEFYGSVYFQCAPDLWDAIHQRKLKLTDGTLLTDHLKSKGIKKLGNCDPKATPSEGSFVYHVKRVEEKFWAQFPQYVQWKRDFYDAYRRNGGFMSKVGFAFSGLMNKNDVLNYAIQCDAFMGMLWSLIRINRKIRKYRMRTNLLGEIHDSCQGDSPPKEIDDLLNLAHEIMVNDLTKEWDWITVPLETESEVSPVDESWFKKEVWTPDDDDHWSPKRKGS